MARTVIYHSPSLRDRWPKLAKHWRRKYPQLFDVDDVRLTRTQPKNHFREWAAAIHVYRKHGACVLVEKYNARKSHPRKRALYESLLSPQQRDVLDRICMHVQPPDLLVYRPGSKRFWFVEVKGEREPISPKQVRSHRLIAQKLRVRVDLVEVRIGARSLPNMRLK